MHILGILFLQCYKLSLVFENLYAATINDLLGLVCTVSCVTLNTFSIAFTLMKSTVGKKANTDIKGGNLSLGCNQLR